MSVRVQESYGTSSVLQISCILRSESSRIRLLDSFSWILILINMHILKILVNHFLTLFRVATGDYWKVCYLMKIIFFKLSNALRHDGSPHSIENQFMNGIPPIYFVVFVLINADLVVVLMKKLDVNKNFTSRE